MMLKMFISWLAGVITTAALAAILAMILYYFGHEATGADPLGLDREFQLWHAAPTWEDDWGDAGPPVRGRRIQPEDLLWK